MILISVLLALIGFSASCPQDPARHNPAEAKPRAYAEQASKKRKLREAEVKAVIEAVEDEIYDYGYERGYYEIGNNLGTSLHWRGRLPIYISPEVEDGEGEVIYKLMPYGEVFRAFEVEDDDSVILYGNPQNGFPPTQESSTKTVYMDDDEVCQMKHKWLRRSFEVDDSPTPEMRQEAVRRQKLRTGFSDWEYAPSKNDILFDIISAHSFGRNGGFVPDEKTAVHLAEAVLSAIYGEQQVTSEQPFSATLKGGVWTVTGSLPKGAAGGVAEARISKKTGEVLSVFHGK
jgi:NTF2 fold immunity protein